MTRKKAKFVYGQIPKGFEGDGNDPWTTFYRNRIVDLDLDTRLKESCARHAENQKRFAEESEAEKSERANALRRRRARCSLKALIRCLERRLAEWKKADEEATA